MSDRSIHQVKVGIVFDEEVLPVGRLALRDGQIYFEYDNTFIDRGLEISPIKCPLRAGIQTFDNALFAGLPGVFNDSLPDGWGRLLLDRHIRLQGILPDELSPLDRLAYTGHTGIGALVYDPEHDTYVAEAKDELDLDYLATQAEQVWEGAADEVLQELLVLNGSAAGAHPKAMISVDDSKGVIYGMHPLQEGFEPWLVKFPNTRDSPDAGAIEYVYALMAKDAGLEMSDTYLFQAQKNAGYFATKRFDRDGHKRLHCHSACGLLHVDFRIPSLDYEVLLTVAMGLARDIREVEKMFRLAVFNVMSHNRDDHAKNFSFLMDECGEWQLSPAYDLTFSSGVNGEQSTTVMCEGKNPSRKHLMQLGQESKLSQLVIDATIEQTETALSRWRSLATEHGIRKANIALIEKRINNVRR